VLSSRILRVRVKSEQLCPRTLRTALICKRSQHMLMFVFHRDLPCRRLENMRCRLPVHCAWPCTTLSRSICLTCVHFDSSIQQIRLQALGHCSCTRRRNGSLGIGTLNMKQAHMQAGRLASTRGNYCTAQRKLAHSTTEVVVHHHIRVAFKIITRSRGAV
jgi:hypothetical protein